MGAEFRILGDVEVLADGRHLDVGHARQRCVLACLLVDVNRGVSAEQLIHRVWGDAPPQKSRNAVAAYVSRLRGLFAGVGEVEIVRTSAGYTLRATVESVDLHAFRRLVSQARATADAAEAVVLFESALSHWRGEPLASIDTPWVNDLRNRLAAEHLSVLLDRNDVALTAGRHAELLNDLDHLALRHPLDERVVGQLMLAQYRSGRQADSLETYRRMRERLVDELGVDPGQPLQAVYQRILDGEPTPTAAPPASPVRAVVSRRTTRLIGRDDDIARALDALAERRSVVTLVGVGGVGKTRLALEAAERAGSDYADGVATCELAPLTDGSDVPQAVAVGLGLRLVESAGVDQVIVDYLRDRELLLVIDNCEHVLSGVVAVVDRIAGECPDVAMLATSREPLGIAGEKVLPVSPLDQGAAAELFAERARAVRPDFDASGEPIGAIAEICRRLDGVPLALELAAARMRAMSSLDVARRLDRLRLLTGGARGAHPRQQSVAATIDWSYRLLSDDEQQLFDRLSVFAGGFDLEAAHAVGGTSGSEDDTVDLLTALVDKSMVVVRGAVDTTRYDILDTLRAYGRERLQDRGIADGVVERHAQYFVDLLERVAAGLGGADEAAWVDRIAPKAGTRYTAPDFDNIRLAFDHAMATGNIDLALRLVSSLPEVHLRIGYHSIEWAERAVAAADPGHPLYAAAVGTVARATWVLGRFARTREVAELAAGLSQGPTTSFIAYAADMLADVALYQGGVADALSYYECLRSDAPAAPDVRRLLLILDKITLCHQKLGLPGGGLDAAQEAIRVAETSANPSARALARCSLGRALSASEPDRALTLFEEAGKLAASVENNWLIAVAMMEAAGVHAVCSAPAVAARALVETLDLWEKGGPTVLTQQWDTLGHAARALLRAGAKADALAVHHTLAASGIEPPLTEAQVCGAGDVEHPVPGESDVVDYARTALRRHFTEAPSG